METPEEPQVSSIDFVFAWVVIGIFFGCIIGIIVGYIKADWVGMIVGVFVGGILGLFIGFIIGCIVAITIRAKKQGYKKVRVKKLKIPAKKQEHKKVKGTIVGIIAAVLIIVVVAYFVMRPKEQVILDETASVYLDTKEYQRELKAGQIIHVTVTVDQSYADVRNAYSLVLSVKNPRGQTVLDSGDMFETGGEYSFDLTVTSSGIHTFEIVNYGDYPDKVWIKATVKSTSPVSEEPARLVITSLDLTPTEAIVGQTVTVSATIVNFGGKSGFGKVTLTVNGIEVDTKYVTIAGGETETVTFTLVENLVGTYVVEINGYVVGSLKVKLSLVFEISNLTLNPKISIAGRPVEISVTVSNPRDEEKTGTLTLKIDNRVEATREITLAGWSTQTVSFTVTENVAKTYTVGVDGLQDTLEVLGATVGLWHLDGNANDETANANHGTVHGATLAPGKFRGAYDFDGIDDYISGPNRIFTMPDEVTFEAWVKPASIPSGESSVILAHGDGGHFILCLANTGTFQFGVWHPDVTWTTVTSKENIIPNNWYYVAGVWKNLSYIRIYVNGVLENDISVTKPLGNPGVFYPFIIGAYNRLDRGFWHGTIDEIRISRVARTADEIRLYFESGLPHRE
jgi:hypothetical protein